MDKVRNWNLRRHPRFPGYHQTSLQRWKFRFPRLEDRPKRKSSERMSKVEGGERSDKPLPLSLPWRDRREMPWKRRQWRVGDTRNSKGQSRDFSCHHSSSSPSPPPLHCLVSQGEGQWRRVRRKDERERSAKTRDEGDRRDGGTVECCPASSVLVPLFHKP